ncbi:SDR family oxidoreductase [Streptomyces sp. NPDC005017]|uniref:SDR family oxidoreductase n=1 Tax=Streptomyces sp. NPDC005017 TaxID=3364706 RepID=UPI00367DD475
MSGRGFLPRRVARVSRSVARPPSPPLDGSPLRGRVAVVTGAARGVGAALAVALSHAGARVALLGREEERLREATAGMSSPGLCVEVDVTDLGGLEAAAREVEARLGPADVVVANAGIAVSGPFRDTDPDLWRRVVEVNLLGAANTARAFLPHLTRTRGYFLEIASTAAFGSAPMMSAYCASKAGAESFAQALRGELAPEGIGVGIAYLHWTGTDMIDGLDDNPVLRALRAHQPWFARRVQTPARVAGLLTAGIERRAPAVYAPPWLRWCQPLRPVFPMLVTHISRRELRQRTGPDFAVGTGLLGAGGLADWNAGRPSPRHRRDAYGN